MPTPEKTVKVAIVVGTRPEIIKMAPVIHQLTALKENFIVIHSNQHYSPEMDEIFFQELQLPRPHYNLNVGSGKHANQIGNIMIKLEPIMERELPDVLLVQGDTNTVVAAAMVASKHHIKIGHVEAGLRSYDRRMPEETNRIITDHLSDYLFAVSQIQREILLGEGRESNRISVIGNTIVDCVLKNKKIAEKDSTILSSLNLVSKEFCLATIHRSSNVDEEVPLREICQLLAAHFNEFKLELVWPMHPRTLKKLKEYNIALPEGVRTISPLGYFDFLRLQMEAKIILTDSGGVQEESCVLGTPCLTLRENTERPETLQVGSNFLVGRNITKALEATHCFFNEKKTWSNPFGDGQAAKRIVETVTGRLIGNLAAKKTVTVIGLGYMGLPMAAILACVGHEVSGIDINEVKIDLINCGGPVFEEQGLHDLVAKAMASGRFKASTKFIQKSQYYIVSVPTPSIDNKCDLTYVTKACESLAEFVDNDSVVIVESTIRPGTMEDVVRPIFKRRGKRVHLVHCPERAIPGNTLHELIFNDRLVGGVDKQSTQLAMELYKSFCKGVVHETTAKVAEASKLMENTFRDVNIALANEFDEVLSEYGIDSREAIRLANKHPRVNILQPGPGVGGHCIAVDPWFLVEETKAGNLIRTARKINDERPMKVASQVLEMTRKFGKNVVVLGVAYKKNVDDARETPALKVVENLLSHGLNVKIHDPFVKEWDHQLSPFDEVKSWGDVYVLVTDHDFYKSFDFNKERMLDTRGLFWKEP